jgi:plastocyanin
MKPKHQLRKGLNSGKAEIMKRNFLVAIGCFLALSLAASAGTLSGSVKGAQGQSVVYLEAAQATAPAPAPKQAYKMDQKGMKFIPDVLVVPVGATVEFDNEDAAAHNVYWPSISGDKKLKHNLGTFPTGQKAAYKFDHPGVVPVLCNVHPDMSAYIIVTPTPYYAQTDQILGGYFIQNVPDGQYKAIVWHKGKSTSQVVKVAGNTKVDFTIGK